LPKNFALEVSKLTKNQSSCFQASYSIEETAFLFTTSWLTCTTIKGSFLMRIDVSIETIEST